MCFKRFFFNEITLDCSESPYFSTHAKEKASKASAKHARGGGGGSRENIFFSVPTPSPVKSPVLHWHPVLSQFNLHIQRSNKNRRKQRAVYSNPCQLFSFYVLLCDLFFAFLSFERNVHHLQKALTTVH